MSRPNIVITIADDQRFDTIGRHGNRQIHTPSLDRLADRGTSYRRAQHGGSTHGGVCAPSRAQLHTGQSLFHTSDSMCPCEPTMPRKATRTEPHPTLGRLLRDAGYDTFATGKWHNGDESFLSSFNKGKRIFMGGMSAHFCVIGQDLPNGSGTLGPKHGLTGHSTDLFASAAMDFLKTCSPVDEKPFFLYVAFTAPHDPRTTYWRYRSRYKDEQIDLPASFKPEHPFPIYDKPMRDDVLAESPRQAGEARMQAADYYAMITHMDERIGELHNVLRDRGLEDNTIVAHTADHGIAIGHHGLYGKQQCYDHSIRVPLIVAGPGFERGVNDDRLCHQHDLFPTLLDHAGMKGVRSDFEHLQSSSRRPTISSSFGHQVRTIRTEKLKLIAYNTPGGRITQLFNTTTDPHEVNDLSRDPSHASEAKLLHSMLVAEMGKADDPLAEAFS